LPGSEVLVKVFLAHSYPGFFRTGDLSSARSLVFRTEDISLRFSLNQSDMFFVIETVVGDLNQGFPFSLLQCRQGRTRVDEWVILKKCVRCMQ
jgi:hypothetical protein